jgi:excisionase family DNA binding protein
MIIVPPKFAGQAAVSPDEAAEILGISTSTFYRQVMPHIYSNTILSLKIGAARRIIVSSLLAWAEQETQKTER